MRYHQMMTLFAGTGTFYPAPGKTSGTSWGASTLATEWTFGDGKGGNDPDSSAVIRSILVPNSASGTPTVTLRDGAGLTVMSWVLGTGFAQDVLLGVDGVRIDGGFSIVTTAAAYLVVVYDKE